MKENALDRDWDYGFPFWQEPQGWVLPGLWDFLPAGLRQCMSLGLVLRHRMQRVFSDTYSFGTGITILGQSPYIIRLMVLPYLYD